MGVLSRRAALGLLGAAASAPDALARFAADTAMEPPAPEALSALCEAQNLDEVYEVLDALGEAQDSLHSLNGMELDARRGAAIQSMRSWSPAFREAQLLEDRLRRHQRQRARRRWISNFIEARRGELLGDSVAKESPALGTLVRWG